jgi:hypothetical protein
LSTYFLPNESPEYSRILGSTSNFPAPVVKKLKNCPSSSSLLGHVRTALELREVGLFLLEGKKLNVWKKYDKSNLSQGKIILFFVEHSGCFLVVTLLGENPEVRHHWVAPS